MRECSADTRRAFADARRCHAFYDMLLSEFTMRKARAYTPRRDSALTRMFRPSFSTAQILAIDLSY